MTMTYIIAILASMLGSILLNDGYKKSKRDHEDKKQVE